MDGPKESEDEDEDERDTIPPPARVDESDVILLENDEPLVIQGSLMPPAEIAEAEQTEVQNQIEEEVDSDLDNWMSKNILPSVPPPADEEDESFYDQFEKKD